MQVKPSLSLFTSHRLLPILLALPLTVTIAGLVQRPATAAVAYKSLHDFSAYPEGAVPNDALVLANDGNFYGVTQSGGKYGLGAIYRLTPAGVYTIVYSFPGATGPGRPSSGLALASDGKLYGGCLSGNVAIYRYDPQTNAVTNAAQIPSYGLWSTPIAAPDGALYGADRFGGAFFNGAIVRYQPGGTIKIIHSFTSNEGVIFFLSNPISLGPDGYIYGITSSGGANGLGIVFKMNLGGTLIKLHDIATGEGYQATGAPTVGRDNTLIYANYLGGPNALGSICKMGTNGKAFTILHAFATGEPNYLQGKLFQASDNRFYGGAGGVSGSAIVSIGSDGVYRIVHTLSEQEGQYPDSDFILGRDGLMYGVAYAGGTNNAGTVFRVATTGQFTPLKSFKSIEGAGLVGAPVVAADGNFYGVTRLGGAYNNGSIYRTTPASVTTTIHSFPATDGGFPTALVLGPDGAMYGTTNLDSANTSIIYRITVNGMFTPIHTFIGDESRRLSIGGDHHMYGATNTMVYAVNTSGTITPIAAVPNSLRLDQVVRAGDGNLYSVQSYGGAYGVGALYKITSAGSFTTAYNFNSGTDGYAPMNLTVGRDGNLYGGATSAVFRYSVLKGTYTILHQFNDNLNQFTFDSIAVKSDGTLFGISGFLGDSNNLYKIDTNGVYTEQTALPAPNNAAIQLYPELAFTSDGSLYGSWYGAGTHNNGVIFKFLGL